MKREIESTTGKRRDSPLGNGVDKDDATSQLFMVGDLSTDPLDNLLLQTLPSGSILPFGQPALRDDVRTGQLGRLLLGHDPDHADVVDLGVGQQKRLEVGRGYYGAETFESVARIDRFGSAPRDSKLTLESLVLDQLLESIDDTETPTHAQTRSASRHSPLPCRRPPGA